MNSKYCILLIIIMGLALFEGCANDRCDVKILDGKKIGDNEYCVNVEYWLNDKTNELKDENVFYVQILSTSCGGFYNRDFYRTKYGVESITFSAVINYRGEIITETPKNITIVAGLSHDYNHSDTKKLSEILK